MIIDSFIRYRGSERSIAMFDLSSRLLGDGEWEAFFSVAKGTA
ncbi:hypothetical protein [Microcystis aeruginosa]|nr:hypothetical protein [Microcystis aeruginosa]